MVKLSSYKNKIKEEGIAFDKQVYFRHKRGLIPDLRRLKKNNYFYNNPWRDPEFFNIQWMGIINKIIGTINKKKQSRVLEIGCGTGFLSLEIARFGHHVTGIDVSKHSIFEAEKYASKQINKNIKKRLNYFVGDANEIILEEKFDFLVFYRSLHHFKNIPKLFKNLNKFTKRDCKIIVCEPMRKNFEKKNATFANLLRITCQTWQSYEKKIPNKGIDYKFIKNCERQVLDEYKYKSNKKKYAQSPMDNSTDDPIKLIEELKKFYKINKPEYFDAFVDKLIGGLRGKERFKLARFLKEFDNYLIKERILKGTTIFFSGKKK